MFLDTISLVIEGVYHSLSSVYHGQVLVAAHSPLFLALAAPADLLCFTKDTSGAVDIVRGDRHPALKNWRGQTDLSTLYARVCRDEHGPRRLGGRRATGVITERSIVET